MARHYRADRLEIYRTTPSSENGESDFELVCKLRETRGDAQKIEEALRGVTALTKEMIRASLLELTVSGDDAIIALNAARILRDRIILQRAAAIIVSSPCLSDETKREARGHLGNRAPRIDMLGLGTTKVRGANNRLKRN